MNKIIPLDDVQKGIPILGNQKVGGRQQQKQGVAIVGSVRVWITDNKTGKKRLHHDTKNSIQAAYAQAIPDALDTAVCTSFALDNLFNGNVTPPTTGEDGIAIKDSGGTWYEMIMQPITYSGGWVTIVGTFTGVGITVALAAEVNLGHSYNNPFTRIYAIPASWTSTPVLNTETLTIEWLIKHQVS